VSGRWKDGLARLDGWRRLAVVGPAYGPQWYYAGLRQRLATDSRTRTSQQADGVPCGNRNHGSTAKQHGDWSYDDVACDQRIGGSCSRPWP
jgi:hypothetical protein